MFPFEYLLFGWKNLKEWFKSDFSKLSLIDPYAINYPCQVTVFLIVFDSVYYNFTNIIQSVSKLLLKTANLFALINKICEIHLTLQGLSKYLLKAAKIKIKEIKPLRLKEDLKRKIFQIIYNLQ